MLQILQTVYFSSNVTAAAERVKSFQWLKVKLNDRNTIFIIMETLHATVLSLNHHDMHEEREII